MLIFIAALSGCGQPEPEGTPDYAGAIAEEVLQAFDAGDYVAYSARFDETTKTVISETVFDDVRDFIRDRVGEYKSGEITQVKVEGDKTTVIYKAKFSEEPDGVNVTIIFLETDGDIYISGIGFDSPKLREM